MAVHTHGTLGTSSDQGEPVPAVLTPAGFKASDGTLQYANLDASGNLNVNVQVGGSSGGGGAVTIADGADVAEGSTSDPAWSGTGTGTVVSILKNIAIGTSFTGAITLASKVSTGNSTTATLAAGATYTGTFENVLGYASVVITAISDGAATQDNVLFEWSTDGSNVDFISVENYRNAGTGASWHLPVSGKFFRVSWKSQQNQTFFRLQTIYQPNEGADPVLSLVGDILPASIVVVGADMGGNGPGLGVQPLRHHTGAFSDSAGNSVHGLDVRAQPGVLDSSQFIYNNSGYFPLGATFYDGITALTDQQGGIFRSTANRALHINLRNASGVEVGVATGPIFVSGAVSLSGTSTITGHVIVDSLTGTVTVSGTATVTGHVIVDSLTGNVAVTNTGLSDLDNTIVVQGTGAPSKVIVVAGKTNDATPQYRELPEGAGGRSVIVEGFSGGTAVPISNTSLDGTTLATIDADIKSNITLHAGTNLIGHVIVDSTTGTSTITGHVIVDSLTGTVTVSGTATVTGHVIVDSLTGTVTVSGTATVTNDGTFAKETGGNLATIAANTSGATGSTLTRVNPAWRQSVQFLASNASRKEALIVNETDAWMFLAEGAAASDISYVIQIPPRGRYALDNKASVAGFWNQLPTIGQVIVTERV